MLRGLSRAYLEQGSKKGKHPLQCELKGGGKCTNSICLCSILEFPYHLHTLYLVLMGQDTQNSLSVETWKSFSDHITHVIEVGVEPDILTPGLCSCHQKLICSKVDEETILAYWAENFMGGCVDGWNVETRVKRKGDWGPAAVQVRSVGEMDWGDAEAVD